MSSNDKYEELQSEISELESIAINLCINNVDMDRAIEMLDSEKKNKGVN